MNIKDTVDSLEKAAERISQKRRRERFCLYVAGVEAKLKQADYSLEILSDYADSYDDFTSSTEKEQLSIKEQVEFYSDTFWILIFSSLDIAAQIINQAYNFGLDEKSVSFKGIEGKITSQCGSTNLEKEYLALKKSNLFKNCDRYRNCSAHRRPIYIQEAITHVTHTKGYTVSGTAPMQGVERTLCENPLDPVPKCEQDRKIPDYLNETCDKIKDRLTKILNSLEISK
ncbi:MAG: Cthe_2314 family HEPN domain-containing protein [Opitutae bacterium]|nr:Cthe_2314 family HEPN domain-containing protein [Opitutae bacterium]MDG2345348.1 Cthe_2314 family HEPN domain-containing protein [Opitutae bacterium]